MSQYIQSKDISIIIQGPLYRNPKSSSHFGIMQSLPMLKKCFPQSEIIITTWEYEDISGIEVDKILKLKDPGGFQDINRSTRNFNRQILSTREGILQASRPYVLKTRSDILFTSPEITKITSSRNHSHFKQPITMTNMVFRNHSQIPFLFHPSDVVHFGLKEDVLDLWDIPLEIYEEVVTNGKKNIFYRYSSTCFKYQPEQSLCIRWLKKHGIDIVLETPSELNKNLLKIWEDTIRNNFHIINYENSGIKFPPHFYNSAYGSSTLLKNEEIKSYYILVWINKYILAFFKKTYLLSLIANLLYFFCPSLNDKIFALYRKMRPR